VTKPGVYGGHDRPAGDSQGRFKLVSPVYELDKPPVVVLNGKSMLKQDEMKKALHEAEEKYRHIFENATEGIFQASIDGRFTSANPALARLHGYSSPAELIEAVSSIRDRFFCEPARHKELIRLLLAYDGVSHFEARMARKDGGERWFP
jgi:PAS domain S-box-containing protein